MEAFISRKRRRLSPEVTPPSRRTTEDDEAESTDFKLAVLASLCPDWPQDVLLESLLACDGSVEQAANALLVSASAGPPRKRPAISGHQSSLVSFTRPTHSNGNVQSSLKKVLTQKGKTLHVYAPEDVEAHTPCSIIHNFLSQDVADALLRELLEEAPSFSKETFTLFDRVVESPHSMRFYVDSLAEAQEQKTRYVYNGSSIADVAQTTSEMLKVSTLVKDAVNQEIGRRQQYRNPGGVKLKFQSAEQWQPNASFVNCYDGGKQSVGYHSDQLTYLGPRAVIGSLSLGVAREFRVRRIVPSGDTSTADVQGQIAIHLPHNSLLIMHAEMQEEWKHAVAPAQTIEPHPLAGNKRLNVTYRCYKAYLHPKYTPRCRCKVPAVLRCVQKQAATRGRYMWMCHSGYTPGQTGCSYFEWAALDVDGRPPWAEGYKANANVPAAATNAEP
ncbi:hypothetical protein LTR56_011747 [Elasticomyces elasticus]|nr:hypothetical protein LTR56_011747 [Elasticomyces elasticus]KAK3663281.1 hypothetical protein LTR22_005939 [Elasticomyces elasticus]KAK4929063.1 hypothetical protein LTR49_004260 [Elasticomyces elasticus]KAK5766442.1 hypothetical protein LTS12_003359 [Elasticomyces elasticus]